MAIESLSFRYNVPLNDLPERWIPLIHLYDADLPLFPTHYFHAVPVAARQDPNVRPTDSQRVFGYIERINIADSGNATATVVTNKDLSHATSAVYRDAVIDQVRHRLGLADPVVRQDIAQAFAAPFADRNDVLLEIWDRVVANAYGGKLPFGRLWDEVFGLPRFVASWNSNGGRKGELIQTHYFVSRFGTRIQSSANIPQVDFYLLPTIDECTDSTNPLTAFPEFRELVAAAQAFCAMHCGTKNVAGVPFSKFQRAFAGQLNTTRFFELVEQLAHNHRAAITECFNAFNKGPHRTIIFLMTLADLRTRRLTPHDLTPTQCSAIYNDLEKTYQSPKFIAIYAQQAFGNPAAVPLDVWVKTFFKWPLCISPRTRPYEDFSAVFAASKNLGKVERLFWIAAQARKVHSSACNDALWCIKKASADDTVDEVARGANPLACNVCMDAIRAKCPAYAAIRTQQVAFNGPRPAGATFVVITSAGNNTAPGQSFVTTRGFSIYSEVVDDFSPKDDPGGYTSYPSPPHSGASLTVEEFIQRY